MTTWRLILHSPASGARNMAIDEAVLEHAGRGEVPPTLRLFAWNPPCLSLGYAQPFTDVDITRLETNNWEVVRRITGGRAILHADELTYSVTGPSDEPNLAGTVLESYYRLSGALQTALSNLGLPVEIKKEKTENESVQNPVCFEVPSTFEITVKEKKIIGSAQARRKSGVLQHGSLPLVGDLTRICQVLIFSDESARLKAMNRLLARATTVESIVRRAVSWDAAAQVFIQAFESQLGVTLATGDLIESELELVEELISKKYAHPSWTERI